MGADVIHFRVYREGADVTVDIEVDGAMDQAGTVERLARVVPDVVRAIESVAPPSPKVEPGPVGPGSDE